MSAVTPETDVIRKHRKEEIRDEEFKEQEIRIPGSCHSGSIGNCRDHSHDRLRHPGKQAG